MTDEEIMENGRRLFQSADNLRRSAADIEALLKTLWQALEDEKFFGQVKDSWGENAGSDGGWVASAYAHSAGILSRPERVPGQRGASKKAKQVGTISIITRLCNTDNVDIELQTWPWLRQACLIVGWHPKENAEDYWEIGNFDPDDENLASIAHAGNGLWAWRENGDDYSYFFVLPIFALSNEDKLKQFVLRPLKILFNTDDPTAAAQDALRDVPALLPRAV